MRTFIAVLLDVRERSSRRLRLERRLHPVRRPGRVHRGLAGLLCMAAISCPMALPARDLAEELRERIPALMRGHSVGLLEVGMVRRDVPVLLRFSPDGVTELTDRATADETVPLFLVGPLSSALLAIPLSDELDRSVVSWREAFPSGSPGSVDRLALFGRFQEAMERPGDLGYVHQKSPLRYMRASQALAGLDPDRAFLLALYHSVAGLPGGREASEMGVVAVRPAYVPFAHARFSADGLQLLSEYLAGVRTSSIAGLQRDVLADVRMTQSRLLEDPAGVPGIAILPDDVLRALKTHPGVFGLATNGRDLLRLARRLSHLAVRDSHRERENGIWGAFVRSPGLGGFSGPFHVSQPCNRWIYEASGGAGDDHSLMMFSREGAALVVVSRGEDVAGQIADFVRPALAGCRLSAEGPGRDGAASSHGGSVSWMESVVGVYRPDDPAVGGLAFLGDVRVEAGAKGALRMRRMMAPWEELDLVSVNEAGLFALQGVHPMEGWRVRFLHGKDPVLAGAEAGEVTGLVTDGMTYRRVAVVDSAWGRCALGVVALVVVFTSLWRQTRRRTRTRRAA